MTMRIVMTLAAGLVAATATVSSASAGGTIGCDPGFPTWQVDAANCSFGNYASRYDNDGVVQQPYAMAPRAYAAAPRKYRLPRADRDDTARIHGRSN